MTDGHHVQQLHMVPINTPIWAIIYMQPNTVLSENCAQE
jgi:hypothetical protein